MIEDITLKIVQNFVKNNLSLFVDESESEKWVKIFEEFEANPTEFEKKKNETIDDLLSNLSVF